MTLHGYKTYVCSIVLAAVGLAILFFPPATTWSNPSASNSTIIGALMLALAASTASLRHAVHRAEANIVAMLRRE